MGREEVKSARDLAGAADGKADQRDSDPLPLWHHNAPPGTSEVAAERIAEHAPPMRDRIHAAILERGEYGLTDEQGELALALKPQTYTPRRGELVREGRVVDSGRRRPTSSGCPAAVWVASEFAERAG